ncbi:MAG: hypothetical protein ACLFSE_15385 [Spirochaetia bacterium]
MPLLIYYPVADISASFEFEYEELCSSLAVSPAIPPFLNAHRMPDTALYPLESA